MFLKKSIFSTVFNSWKRNIIGKKWGQMNNWTYNKSWLTLNYKNPIGENAWFEYSEMFWLRYKNDSRYVILKWVS